MLVAHVEDLLLVFAIGRVLRQFDILGISDVIAREALRFKSNVVFLLLLFGGDCSFVRGEGAFERLLLERVFRGNRLDLSIFA